MILLDTHVLVWAAEGNRRLGETARATIEETRRRDRVGVSAITPWEIALLVREGPSAARNGARSVDTDGAAGTRR